VIGDNLGDGSDDRVDAAGFAVGGIVDGFSDSERGVVAQGAKGQPRGRDALDVEPCEDFVASSEVVENGDAAADFEEGGEFFRVDGLGWVDDDEAIGRG
jgi:hypothetical protein